MDRQKGAVDASTLQINPALEELEKTINISNEVIDDLIKSLNQVLEIEYEVIVEQAHNASEVEPGFSLENSSPLAKIIFAYIKEVQILNRKITFTRDKLGL